MAGKRATEGALGELHDLFAKTLYRKLLSGECTPSELNVIRQFLKDNSIECIGEENENIQDILKGLPTYLQQDAEHMGHQNVRDYLSQ